MVHDLPSHKWRYNQLLWSEPRSSIEYRNRQYVRHEILGARTLVDNGVDYTWINRLILNEVPWLEDHKVGF